MKKNIKKDEITEITDLNPIYKNQIIIELGKDNTIVNVDKLIFLLISYLLLMIITLAKGSEHVKSIIGIERYNHNNYLVVLSLIGSFMYYTFHFL